MYNFWVVVENWQKKNKNNKKDYIILRNLYHIFNYILLTFGMKIILQIKKTIYSEKMKQKIQKPIQEQQKDYYSLILQEKKTKSINYN